AQDLERLQRVLSEADARVEDDALLFYPRGSPGLAPLVEPAQELVDRIAARRQRDRAIRRDREAVHRDEVRVRCRRDLEHRGRRQSSDVVDDRGAELERTARDLGMIGIDTDPRRERYLRELPDEPLEDRREPRPFLVRR